MAADSALCPALHCSGDYSPFKSRALLSRAAQAASPLYIRPGRLLLGQAWVLEFQEVGGSGALSPDLCREAFLEPALRWWPGDGCSLSQKPQEHPGGWPQGPSPALTSFTQVCQRPWPTANFMEVGVAATTGTGA